MKKLLLSLLCLAGLSAGAATVTDVITVESLKGDSNYSANSTSYTTFTVTGESGAVYALQCAHNKGTCLQFRSTNNNSGLVATTSAGTVTNVTITWASNTTNGRTLNIYGYDAAISTPAGLYGNSAPTVAGTVVCGTSTSYDFTNAPEYVGMRSNNGAMYIDKIEITWDKGGDGPVIARPTFTTEPGTYVESVDVEIACETEGAEIYYTLDGTLPTNASTKYTEPFTLTATTTVKAIAYVGEDASSVLTGTFEVVETMKLEDVLALTNNEGFVMGTELVVAYINEADNRYFYVYGDEQYTLIYDSAKKLSLAVGDVIAKGWEGKMSYYNGLPELVVTSASLTTTPGGTVPELKKVKGSEVTNALVNTPVIIEDVTFAKETPDATVANFTGTADDTELTFRNTYKLASVEAGKYNVSCIVSVYQAGLTSLGSTLQLVPFNFEKATTGIAAIEAENGSEAVYYNLQGVRVAQPESGLYIEVRGGKATKVVK